VWSVQQILLLDSLARNGIISIDCCNAQKSQLFDPLHIKMLRGPAVMGRRGAGSLRTGRVLAAF
jgi:hypothetical protein